jgi:hypothetical protein
MSGDQTRFTHQPRKRYSGVLMQQGRVQLDADWNEGVESAARRWELQAIDTFGGSAVPQTTATAFELTALAGPPPDLAIGVGRFYVDGLLAEVLPDEAFTYLHQPFLPEPEPFADVDGPNGIAYLDVWKREVTYVEDPEILDVALGGPDTATRVQIVWQVKLHGTGQTVATCGTDLNALFPPSGGRLSSRVIAPPPDDNPCIISPSGGFRGLENRLYRIEIHTPGDAATARFKWSRDNGSIVSTVGGIAVSGTQTTLTVARIGRDEVLRFRANDWVEVLDDHRELMGLPGVMARVVAPPDEANLTIRLDRALPLAGPGGFATNPDELAARHTRVKRWDQSLGVDANGLLPITGGWQPIEEGVEVQLTLPGGGTFHAADYWVFAARTATGTVEELAAAPPRGIVHHYAQLATLSGLGGPNPNPVVTGDCRPIWPPSAEGCCTVTVGDGVRSHGQYQSLAAAVAAVAPLPPYLVRVCLLPGDHEVEQTIAVDRDQVTIGGCGAASRVHADDTALAIGGDEVTLEGFVLEVGSDAPCVTWTGDRGRVRGLAIQSEAGPGIVSSGSDGLSVRETAVMARPALSLQGDQLDVVGNRLGAGGLVLRTGSAHVQVVENEIGAGHGDGITLGTELEGDQYGLLREIDIRENVIVEMTDSGIASTAGQAALTCIDFSARPQGPVANPLHEQGATFDVRNAQGAPVPQGRIFHVGNQIGLDLGFRTVVTLPTAVATVQLRLVHSAAPVTATARSASGAVVDQETMTVGGGQPQTLTLTGQGITTVELMPPQDEAILQEICFGAGGESQGRPPAVFGLRIVDNMIQGCIREQAIPRPDQLPHGGIVLTDGRRVLIQRNRIELNGAKGSPTVPVCGIFALRSRGIEVADNQVLENGRSPQQVQDRRNRGGIVVLEAGTPVSSLYVKQIQQAAIGSANVLAARVAGNTVVAPGTLALRLTGRGPMQVTDNRLTTHGVVGFPMESLPAALEFLSTLPGLAPILVSALVQPELFVGAIQIVNLGEAPILQGLIQGRGFSSTAVNAKWSAAGTRAAASVGPGGAVQFSDNQVVLSMRTEPPTILLAGTVIMTLDDLVSAANQTSNDLAASAMFFDAIDFATTARVTANGYTETLLRCIYSLISQAWLASTGTDNQGTHCIAILGSVPARTVDRDNIALACLLGAQAGAVGGGKP